MGKVLKPLLLVAAVAINVIPGVGQALSVAAFSALGTGFVSAAAISAFTLAASTGLALASGAIRTGQAGAAAQLSRLTLSFDAETPRKIVFGSTAMNADVLYQEASGADQEYIDLIIAVAAHKVAAITSLYSEDKLMWTAAGGAQGIYAGYLTVTAITEGTRSNGIAINGGGIWNADCTLTGCAYLQLRIKRTGSSSKASSPFAAGLPSRITIIGDGMPVYDPRRDSTVGGSGSMRANDQTTWAFADGGTDLGNNPALQAITFLLGWKVGGVLSVGAGVAPSRLAMADWIAAANTCDDSISTGSGSQKRYQTAGVFSDDDAPGAVLDTLCLHMNGNLRDTGGRIGIRMAINDTGGTLVSFTEDDLQGGYEWLPQAPLNESFNIVRGKFTDASTTALYQAVPYPARSVTSPDGNQRTLPLDLPMVQDGTRAQRIAEQVLRAAQYGGRFTGIFGPRAWACEVGQPVRLTNAGTSFSNKLFRVERQELKIINSDEDAAAVCQMTLRELDASIYGWSTDDAGSVDAAVAPVSYLPSSQPFLAVALSDVNPTESSKLAGISPNADVTAETVPSLEVLPTVTINFDYTGSAISGALPRTLRAVRRRGGVDVSATTSWSITPSGCTASIDSAGVITISACSASGAIAVLSSRDGTDLGGSIAVSRIVGAAPSGGGGGGGTTATDSTLDSFSSTSYGSAIGGPMTVKTGSVGEIDLYADLALIVSEASPAGSFGAYLKWQWRIVGGSWADAGSEEAETSPCIVSYESEFASYFRVDGAIICNRTVTGLSATTDYEVQLLARVPSGSRIRSVIGTISGVGS